MTITLDTYTQVGNQRLMYDKKKKEGIQLRCFGSGGGTRRAQNFKTICDNIVSLKHILHKKIT